MTTVEELVLAGLPDEGAVEVTGDSELARELRERLASRSPQRGLPPDAIVETTGEPDVVRAALERVDDLGTVVLAGPVADAAVSLDLYADLHVRGLTVVGVPAER